MGTRTTGRNSARRRTLRIQGGWRGISRPFRGRNPKSKSKIASNAFCMRCMIFVVRAAEGRPQARCFEAAPVAPVVEVPDEAASRLSKSCRSFFSLLSSSKASMISSFSRSCWSVLAISQDVSFSLVFCRLPQSAHVRPVLLLLRPPRPSFFYRSFGTNGTILSSSSLI